MVVGWRLFGMGRRSRLCSRLRRSGLGCSGLGCCRLRRRRSWLCRRFRCCSRLLGMRSRLRRWLRVSSRRCTWGMRRGWRFIFRLRRFSGPGCRLRRRSSRTWSIRLCSGGGFGDYRIVLQFRYAGCGTRHCGMRGNTVIRRSKIGFVLFRNLLVLLLRRSRRKVRLLRGGFLLSRRLRCNSIRPAIETGVRVVDDRRVGDDGCIHIGSVNDRRVHGYDCCVVSEGAATPLTASEAASAITESVVHASVEADLRPPIAGMEYVNTSISPTPITGCPEIARLRRFDPGSGHPVVVADAIPRPIAGRPHEVGLWTGRLHVNRKSRRLYIDADAN